MRAIYGKKKLMTRIFDENGKVIPVTIIEVGENVVSKLVQKKDGENVVQIAAGTKKRLNKAETGQLKNLKIKPSKLYEIRTSQQYKVGDKISLDGFKEKEEVNVTAISKGKGFAGTVKRHHFHTGPKTHGSNNYRQPGSIGDTGPQRVVKGRRMAGHLGAKRATIKNLEIIKIELEKKYLYLRGAVPGANESGILIWSNHEG